MSDKDVKRAEKEAQEFARLKQIEKMRDLTDDEKKRLEEINKSKEFQTYSVVANEINKSRKMEMSGDQLKSNAEISKSDLESTQNIGAFREKGVEKVFFTSASDNLIIEKPLRPVFTVASTAANDATNFDNSVSKTPKTSIA